MRVRVCAHLCVVCLCIVCLVCNVFVMTGQSVFSAFVVSGEGLFGLWCVLVVFGVLVRMCLGECRLVR